VRRVWCAGLRMLGADSEPMLYGGNTKGILLHFTAPRMIHTKLVSREEMSQVSSFAIVRNPFSRMVSIYMYNKPGSLESFDHFVRRWQKLINNFNKMREEKAAKRGCAVSELPPPEEWEVYCHVIPMHEFTHEENGTKQVVRYVIKQEEHPSLHTDTPKPSVANLSPALKQALLDMPHTNARKRSKPWKEYYTPELEKIVYEMYKRDFEVFGYPSQLEVPKEKDGAIPHELSLPRLSSDPPPGGWPQRSYRFSKRSTGKGESSYKPGMSSTHMGSMTTVNVMHTHTEHTDEDTGSKTEAV